MKPMVGDESEERASSKYKPEDFEKFTLFQTEDRLLFCAWGGNGRSYLRALRLDTPRRKSMIGIGNTLVKGRWWRGEETGDVPKFLWAMKKGNRVNIFIGRLAILLETQKIELPPHVEIRKM